MNDRREPTISGMRIDPEDLRKSGERPQQKGRSSTQQNTAVRPRASGSQRAQAPQRPIIVRSKIAPLAFILALAAGGAAGYFGWLSYNMQQKLLLAEDRLASLEEKLVMSDDESNASTAVMQASLKDAHSEIRKLWGVSYDRNRKSIADNKKQIEVAKKQASDAKKNASSLQSEITRVEDLIDAQKNSMNAVEQSAATISAQARALNEKNARAEQKLNELKEQISGIEQDIQAINGFRRSVNQQLLELKNGAAVN